MVPSIFSKLCTKKLLPISRKCSSTFTVPILHFVTESWSAFWFYYIHLFFIFNSPRRLQHQRRNICLSHKLSWKRELWYFIEVSIVCIKEQNNNTKELRSHLKPFTNVTNVFCKYKHNSNDKYERLNVGKWTKISSKNYIILPCTMNILVLCVTGSYEKISVNC